MTGQEISWSRADWIPVRPPSATATPAEARSLLVSRERDGIVGSDSVNDRRGQSVLPQAQRRFVHRRLVGLPASGKSRGRVVTRPNDRAERTPHPGQQCTSAQAVTSASIRFPDSSDSAEVTLYPLQTEQQRCRIVVIQARGPSARSSIASQHE